MLFVISYLLKHWLLRKGVVMEEVVTTQNRKSHTSFSSSLSRPQGCVVALRGTVDCPVGYLWREGRRHWFTYLPAYLANPTALPLHPIDIPLTSDVIGSEGEGLDGRLAIFGSCRPAKESEIATEILIEAVYGRAANGLTSTAIGSLAGASLLTAQKGINGLNFDCSGWPDVTMKPEDRAFWRTVDFVIPCSKARASLERAGFPRWVANAPQRFRPSPMEGVTVEASKGQGFICIGYQAEHCVRQRVEAVYLRLAGQCGLSVTKHRRLTDGCFSLFWRDGQGMFSAPLGGDRPEEIAIRTKGLMNRSQIVGTEVYSRLCFLLLGGFSNKVYEEALRIQPRVDVRSRRIVEYVWEFLPIQHLTTAGMQEKDVITGEQRIQRLTGIGHQLNLADAFIENTIINVIQQLRSWRSVAEKEGLAAEDIARYGPAVPDGSGQDASVSARMREGIRYRSIEHAMPA